jgi:hypothetical protein
VILAPGRHPQGRSAAEGKLVIRPHLWRQLPVISVMVAVTGIMSFVWVRDVDPDKDFGFTMVLLLLWGICIGESFVVRLIVTPDRVRMFSGNPGRPVRPVDVNHIRAFPWNTVLYDHDGHRTIQTHIDLSRSQLLTLGEVLNVPVWDHRQWHGLKKLRYGVRLNTIPAPERPAQATPPAHSKQMPSGDPKSAPERPLASDPQPVERDCADPVRQRRR